MTLVYSIQCSPTAVQQHTVCCMLFWFIVWYMVAIVMYRYTVTCIKICITVFLTKKMMFVHAVVVLWRTFQRPIKKKVGKNADLSASVARSGVEPETSGL